MQGNPGGLSTVLRIRKGGVAMVKTMLHKVSGRMDTASVAVGWFAFLAAVAVTEPTTKIILQAIARVLP